MTNAEAGPLDHLIAALHDELRHPGTFRLLRHLSRNGSASSRQARMLLSNRAPDASGRPTDGASARLSRLVHTGVLYVEDATVRTRHPPAIRSIVDGTMRFAQARHDQQAADLQAHFAEAPITTEQPGAQTLNVGVLDDVLAATSHELQAAAERCFDPADDERRRAAIEAHVRQLARSKLEHLEQLHGPLPAEVARVVVSAFALEDPGLRWRVRQETGQARSAARGPQRAMVTAPALGAIVALSAIGWLLIGGHVLHGAVLAAVLLAIIALTGRGGHRLAAPDGLHGAPRGRFQPRVKPEPAAATSIAGAGANEAAPCPPLTSALGRSKSPRVSCETGVIGQPAIGQVRTCDRGQAPGGRRAVTPGRGRQVADR